MVRGTASCDGSRCFVVEGSRSEREAHSHPPIRWYTRAFQGSERGQLSHVPSGVYTPLVIPGETMHMPLEGLDFRKPGRHLSRLGSSSRCIRHTVQRRELPEDDVDLPERIWVAVHTDARRLRIEATGSGHGATPPIPSRPILGPDPLSGRIYGDAAEER